MVWPRQKKKRNREQQSSCRNEDIGGAPQRTTNVQVEGYGQEGHVRVEHQGGMGH